MNKIQIIHSFTLQKSGCTTHSLLVAKLKFMEDFEGLREPIKFRPAPRPAPPRSFNEIFNIGILNSKNQLKNKGLKVNFCLLHCYNSRLVLIILALVSRLLFM